MTPTNAHTRESESGAWRTGLPAIRPPSARQEFEEPGSSRRRRPLNGEYIALRAEQRAEHAEATAADLLREVRSALPGGKLLSPSEQEDWLNGHEDGDGNSQPLPYQQPGAEYVQYVATGPRLESLRALSETLASRYGWHPAQATTFVLTGSPPATGVTVSLRQTVGAPPRATVSFDLDEDAESIADRIRALQDEHEVQRRRPDLAKLRALVTFAEEHGTGDEALARWNREHPEWRYRGSRRHFYKAAMNARRALSPAVRN